MIKNEEERMKIEEERRRRREEGIIKKGVRKFIGWFSF
jgi:hypothetical protein